MTLGNGQPHLTRRSVLRAGGLAALAVACRPSAPFAGESTAPTVGRTAYTGAQVYREGQFSPATVIVEAGRIVEVTETGQDGTEAFDGTGMWLIPGIVDAHVHLQFSGAEEILAGGVTTVRDLGSPPDVASDIGRDSALRVVTAGRILTPLRGYPSQSWGADGTSREIVDAGDAAVAVAEQVAAGASVIKVALERSAGPLFDQEVLDVIVAQARKAKLSVTAHVGSADALSLALEHGVDELAHLPLYDVTPAEMARVAEAGMVLVPTLEIRGRDPAALRAVEAFFSASGTVVYGTDLGNTGTAPGIEVAEMGALLSAGMSPEAVLGAGTSAAADHLGLSRVGRIEAGAAADLVGLRGDPFADVNAYDDVALVVAGGTRVVG